MKARRALAAIGLVGGSVFAMSAADTPIFSAAEIQQISALGPWPPQIHPDPSNRVSGQPAAMAFGEQLFHDRRLSRNGQIACDSCHQTSQGLSDGHPRGLGLGESERNTLALFNLRWQRWFGWDGANDNLWAQSLRPLLDHHEMGMSLQSLGQTVREKFDLRQPYQAVFGDISAHNDEAISVNLAKALAAYQETLITPRTAFDDFRDALAQGLPASSTRYPLAAQRGLAIFVGKGRCVVCHSGAQFSNGEFHDIGIPFFKQGGGVDMGRYSGIQALKQSRYNLLSEFNDDPLRRTATATRHVSTVHRNFGEFKVPTLRNIAHTAPYMHNGSLASLREVILHYSELNEDRLHADGERLLVPLHLSEQEIDDLLRFLETL